MSYEHPIDRTAVRVTRFKGWQGRTEGKRPASESWTPFPLKPFKGCHRNNREHYQPDLTGTRLRGVRVLGYWAGHGGAGGRSLQTPSGNSKKVGRWVVQCRCGLFMLLKNKVLRRKLDQKILCSECGRDERQLQLQHDGEA